MEKSFVSVFTWHFIDSEKNIEYYQLSSNESICFHTLQILY